MAIAFTGLGAYSFSSAFVYEAPEYSRATWACASRATWASTASEPQFGDHNLWDYAYCYLHFRAFASATGASCPGTLSS